MQPPDACTVCAKRGRCALGRATGQDSARRLHMPIIRCPIWTAAALALVTAVGWSGSLPAQEVNVGTTGSSSDAPFFIADKKGYFADEGLKVKLIRFDSASKMVPSLGTGELDVGGGATSAGLYNAAKRGVSIKIVADKARSAKGYGFQSVLVRKDLFESGKVRSLKDFKGLKVAISAPGNSENALID